MKGRSVAPATPFLFPSIVSHRAHVTPPRTVCRYIVRQVQLGLKSPKNAVAIAQGGLDYW